MDWTPQTAPTNSEIIKELMSRGRMDFKAQTSPRDSEIINELMSRVTHAFYSRNSTYGLTNHQRTDVTGTHGMDSPIIP